MYSLTEQQNTSIEKLKEIASQQIGSLASLVDEKGRFPRESIRALGRSGWLGLSVSRDLEGMGEGLKMVCAVLDVLAQNCASTAMVYLMHVSGTACYVAHPKGQEKVLRDVARGEHLTTLAWSETGSRSHFWAPVSQATLKSGMVVLNAHKSFVTSAGEADSYVVSTRSFDADTPFDSTLYSVKSADSGLRVSDSWNSLGMRGNASAPMILEQCVIPPNRALCESRKGFSRMLEILPWFNLGNAAISVGIAEAATLDVQQHLTSTRLEHLGSRLADIPILRARLAEMRMETDRARAHLNSAISAVESGAPNAMLMVLESKLAAAESATKVTDLGMQACGGAAYSKHLSLERRFRDARASAIMAPTSDVLKDFIGRALCGMELF
jgi:alkylation response protein AidB-like acyl-CoA dehydrogenase